VLRTAAATAAAARAGIHRLLFSQQELIIQIQSEIEKDKNNNNISRQ
jgi:hypothetical protein